MNGSHEFGITTQAMHYSKYQVMDYTFPIFNSIDVLASRIPIRLIGYGNALRPFPPDIWMAFIISCVIYTIAFVVIYKVYSNLDRNGDHQPKLTVGNQSATTIVIKTVCSVTEPDPILWFPTWSTGKKTRISRLEFPVTYVFPAA